MKDAPFRAKFATVDVTKGRKALVRRIASGEEVRIRVDVTLDCPPGRFDGVSQEFLGRVTSVKAFRSPGAAKRKARRR